MKKFLSFLLLLQLVPISNGQNLVRNYWRGNNYQINAHANDLKTTQLRQKTFDEVWWTINELYYDPTFGGVDWKKMKEVYQPQAMTAKTDDEFHLVLSQMVGELKRSHLAVLSKNQIARNNLCSERTIGIELKIINNQAIVYQVKTNSVAEKSGLKKGFAITQIENETVSEVIHKTMEAANQRKTSESFKKRTIEVSLLQRLCGKPNTQVKVVALDENSVPKTFELIRDGVQIVGYIGLLKKEFNYVAKKLENNIGYIKFSGWDSDLHESFTKTFLNFLQTGVAIAMEQKPTMFA